MLSSEFNGLPRERAEELLRSCCSCESFAAAVAAGRPYADLARLASTAAAAVRALTWPQVEEALRAHPRIGERARGASREARWSRAEQQGATTGGDPEVHQALAEGNREYEDRFGHVFLICASGLGAEEILTALRGRLNNDIDRERSVVRDELAKITELRLRNLENSA